MGKMFLVNIDPQRLERAWKCGDRRAEDIRLMKRRSLRSSSVRSNPKAVVMIERKKERKIESALRFKTGKGSRRSATGLFQAL